MTRKNLFLLGALGVAFGGCAHRALSPDMSPEAALTQACSPGQSVREVSGSVWMKAKSNDASGRFPGVVKVKDEGKLELEVTNLVGGREAFIQVEGSKYRISVPGKSTQQKTGYGSWAGIPLNFANRLFLGRLPCPPVPLAQADQAEIDQDGRLRVVIDKGGSKEIFLYTFRSFAGKPWAESLEWEMVKGSQHVQVQFEFDNPETDTLSPLIWKASSTQGEIQLRWKDRKLVTANSGVSKN